VSQIRSGFKRIVFETFSSLSAQLAQLMLKDEGSGRVFCRRAPARLSFGAASGDLVLWQEDTRKN